MGIFSRAAGQTGTERRSASSKRHKAPVAELAWDASGSLLCSVSWDDTVRLWDVRNRRQAALLKRSAHYIHCGVAFSPDGRGVATLGEEDTVAVHVHWELDTKFLVLPRRESGPTSRLRKRNHLPPRIALKPAR